MRRGSGRGVWSGVCRLAGLATAFLGVLVAWSTVWPVGALGAGDINQSACPSSTESSPGFRSYMPDCRAYELVSPPYKEGAAIFEPAAIATNGEDVIWHVFGTTGGLENEPVDATVGEPSLASYRLTRTATGWRYTALTPPANPYLVSALLAVSPDEQLSRMLWGAQTVIPPHKEDIYVQDRPGGKLLLVGPGYRPEHAAEELGVEEMLDIVGASNDLSHSVFSIKSAVPGGHSDLWPGDTTVAGDRSLYEYVYSGTPSPEPMLVGVAAGPGEDKHLPSESPTLVSNCGTEFGGAGREKSSAYNAISKDGGTIFFTALECGGSPTVNELYARIGGVKTVKISEPVLPGGAAGECNTGEPCATAAHKSGEFQGADEHGRRVFFTSEQPLVNGAPEEGVKLYEERLEGTGPAAKVVEVSDLSNPAGYAGVNPEVQGVVRVSEDGSHVYFVAKAVLASTNGEGKSPSTQTSSPYTDNMYVYEPDPAHPGTSRVVFVATLLTEAELFATFIASGEECSVVEERATHAKVAAEEEARSKGASTEEVHNAGEAADTNVLNALLGTFGPSCNLASLFEDFSVWSGFGTGDQRPAQATPDGRFLVFTSSADLREEKLTKVSPLPQIKESFKVPQLFEYDAEGGPAKSGALRRISIGQDGTYGDNGNVSTFHDVAQIPVQKYNGQDLPAKAGMQSAVSNDGLRVFFTSAAPLAPGAVSGEPSVFEYREGNVYLISDGRDGSLVGNSEPTPGAPDGQPTVQLWGIAAGTQPAGRDVFFTSADPLVPQAGDSQQTLYDAREAGGFPAPALAPGCLGETCRGEAGTAPQLGLAGSSSQLSGENLAPPPQSKPKALTRAQKLARALKACAKKPKRRRARCRARARRLYGKKATAGGARLSGQSASRQRHGNGRSK